jgi:hypothetical protein
VSRIISTESAGLERNQLVRAIIVALRELSQLTTFDDEARDLAAFIVLALGTVSKGVDASAIAWEKRGYWVKADRFRMEWAWADPLASKLRSAVETGDWSSVAALMLKLAEKFKDVRVARNPRVGRPWLGAFGRMTLP